MDDTAFCEGTAGILFCSGAISGEQEKEEYRSKPPARKKLRPNVEAIIKEFVKPLNHKGKLRVREQFKTMMYAGDIDKLWANPLLSDGKSGFIRVIRTNEGRRQPVFKKLGSNWSKSA